MSETPPPDLTQLLGAYVDGDLSARDALIERTYAEMRQMAERQMRGNDPMLQPTALVNDAWLKLFGALKVRPEHRGQFFALAAKIMRGLLIDHVRNQQSQARGGDHNRVTLAPDVALQEDQPIDVLDLCEVLEELKTLDPDQHEMVELRFFAGLTMPEIATATRRSLTTVEREWRAARAWLASRLTPDE